MDAALSARWAFGLALLAVMALAGGELLPTWGERLVGIGGVDHPGTIWTAWALRDALAARDLGRLLHTPWFFHPWGQDLYRHTGLNLLDALIALPFGTGAAGGNAAAGALVGLNGLAAWLAARWLGAAPAVARWAGLAVAVAPFPLYELVEGRPTQALLAPALLAVAAWARLEGGEGRGWVAGGLLALTGYGYWFYGLVGALAAAVLLVGPRWREAGRGLGVAAALVLPLAGPLLLASLRGEVPGMGALDREARLLLHAWQPLVGASGYFTAESFVPTQHALPLGMLAAAWALRRRPLAWALGALLLVLATGPWLLVGDRVLPEPLYHGLAALLPPLERWWHPARTLGIVTAALGVGLARLGPRAVAGVSALTLLQSVLAGLLPLPTWDPSPPAGYRCLAAGDDGGALVELPWTATPTSLAWQPLHRRPILGGMWATDPAFQPPEAPRLRAEDPLLSGLLPRARGAVAPVGDPAGLLALGYRWVVLRRDELPAGEGATARALRRQADAALRDALGPPAWDDARTTIWSLDGAPLPCAADPPPPDPIPGTQADRRRVKALGVRAAHR